MKKIIRSSISLLYALLLVSCWKDEPRLGGRVTELRNGALVPNAQVIFLHSESDNDLFTPMRMYKVGETVSDALGHFEIPDNEEIEYIVAIPPDADMYTDYRAEFSTATYFDEGGIFESKVEAAAWVRLSSVDLEPLNPGTRIELAGVDTHGNYINLDEPYLIKTGSDNPYTVVYWLNNSVQLGPVHWRNTPILAKGDTLDFVIEY